MEAEKQKKLKGLSKAIYILAGIGKVFVVIGMVGLLVAMIIVPVFTSNVKVDAKNNTIKVFDEKLKYDRNDSEIKITYDKHTEKITKNDEVKAINLVIDYLEDNSLNKVTVISEAMFVFAMAILVLSYLELKSANKLFKNIHNEDSPFSEENTLYVNKIAKYMLYSFVLALVANCVLSVISDGTLDFTFNVGSLIYILVAFSLYYIFDYGYKLQQSK